MSNFINDLIEIDKTKLNKQILELIEELEKYDKKNNEICYYAILDEFEKQLKNLIGNNEIDNNLYDLLIRKYH